MYLKKILFALSATSLVLSSALLSQTTVAEAGYISDIQYVPLRSGKGNEFRILNRGLRSGTQFEIIEQDNEWTTVKMPDGETGYIRSQYVTKTPIARQQLAKAQAEIVQLSNSNIDLQRRLAELNELSSDLDAKTKSDATALAATQTELEEIKRLAADTITLNERHRALLNDHQLLQNKANVLTAQVDQYKYNDKQKWFIYGALAVVIGVVITLLVPILKPQKSKSEWLN